MYAGAAVWLGASVLLGLLGLHLLAALVATAVPAATVPVLLGASALGIPVYLAQAAWAVVLVRRAPERAALRGRLVPGLLFLGLAGAGWHLVRGVVEPFAVHARSMEPSFLPGDHFYVAKLLVVRRLRPGDVVAVHVTGDDQHRAWGGGGWADASGGVLLKRAIALSGDRVAMGPEGLFLNGQRVPRVPCEAVQAASAECMVETLADGARYRIVPERTLLGEAVGWETKEVTVPPGSVYLLGDNRPYSYDSRWLGSAPLSSVVGLSEGIYFSYGEPGGFRWSRIGARP